MAHLPSVFFYPQLLAAVGDRALTRAQNLSPKPAGSSVAPVRPQSFENWDD
jgi:hypothetical protein